MSLKLPVFPIAIDDAELATLKHEVWTAIQADYSQEFDDPPPMDFRNQAEIEFGSHAPVKATRNLTRSQVRDLYLAAFLLAEPYHPKAHEDKAADIRAWLRQVGEMLDAAGGIDLMEEAFYAVKFRLNHAIPLSRAWDGIGTWRH